MTTKAKSRQRFPLKFENGPFDKYFLYLNVLKKGFAVVYALCFSPLIFLLVLPLFSPIQVASAAVNYEGGQYNSGRGAVSPQEGGWERPHFKAKNRSNKPLSLLPSLPRVCFCVPGTENESREGFAKAGLRWILLQK